MKPTFILAIFLSAFLLFAVEPLLAKHLVPLYGGSAFVWLASILFFQTVLLVGYGYAYVLARFFAPRTQAFIHGGLLIFSLLFIPLQFYGLSYVESFWPPLGVFILLGMSISFPFVVLCASSPLLQHWYCLLRHTEFPYYYYSISNAGSLLGLMGYILLIEPHIGLHRQGISWSILFVIYTLLCLCCAKKLFTLKNGSPIIYQDDKQLSYKPILGWISLTFLSSALLLSTTQYLTQNVLNLPLTWVIPLALYLITFMFTFSNKDGYNREFWGAAFIIFLLFTLWKIYHIALNGFDAVMVVLALLYSACMICHGELIRLKPSQNHLTLFYLMISLGGVLGGLFANVIAFYLFTNWWDFYFPLIAIMLLTAILYIYKFKQTYQQFSFWMSAISCVTLIFMSCMIYIDAYSPKEKMIDQKRNLYGFLRVYDFNLANPENNVRVLMHGKVMHGMQFIEKAKQQWPTSYYGYRSGGGLALSFLRQNKKMPLRIEPLQVGLIGLGCGVMSALGEKGEQFTFYEIDSDVIQFAQKYFTFLSNSSANNRIILGDARIQLEKSLSESSIKYNLLVVDAFSGDAIPFHVVTKEAMEIYQKHLAQNGIVAFHITNTYLELVPVIKALAQNVGCNYFIIDSYPEDEKNISYSRWALISCNPDLKDWLIKQTALGGFRLTNTDAYKPLLWTDDYNSILHILRLQ